jgi:hypothetical protein
MTRGQNPEQLFAAWGDGWRRGHPPDAMRGIARRIAGEIRRERVFAGVSEDGRTRRRQAPGTLTRDADRIAALVRAEYAAVEREVLGVVR